MVTLACNLASPLQFPIKPSLQWCSVLTGQLFAMELPSLLPPGMSCVQWSIFLSAKGTTPIHNDHQLCKVYGPQCMDIRNLRTWVESSRTDIQMSMINSGLVSLWFWLKQLQKWSKKCLTIGAWQFTSCANRFLNLRKMAGEFYDKGIQKDATVHAKVHRSQWWLRCKICGSPGFPSM